MGTLAGARNLLLHPLLELRSPFLLAELGGLDVLDPGVASLQVLVQQLQGFVGARPRHALYPLVRVVPDALAQRVPLMVDLVLLDHRHQRVVLPGPRDVFGDDERRVALYYFAPGRYGDALLLVAIEIALDVVGSGLGLLEVLLAQLHFAPVTQGGCPGRFSVGDVVELALAA